MVSHKMIDRKAVRAINWEAVSTEQSLHYQKAAERLLINCVEMNMVSIDQMDSYIV